MLKNYTSPTESLKRNDRETFVSRWQMNITVKF